MRAGWRANLRSTCLRPTQEVETTGLVIQQMRVEGLVWNRAPRAQRQVTGVPGPGGYACLGLAIHHLI